jgi:putative ABC transport system ATP-binding protein
MSRIPGRARPRTGRPHANDPRTALPAAGPARVLVELAGVEKTYVSGAVTTPALRGVDLTIGAGEMVAVVGPSGSGKSTVTNLIAGIDRPSAGTVTVAGQRIDTMGEEALARWRGDTVGIVFQFFQLLPTLTALENVALPLDFARRGGARDGRRRARDLLGLVGLGDKADRLPTELSGGEQQRVAIARALACEPALLIGDEPTGNLDSHTADEMFDLLVDVHRRGTTVVFVTHDPQLAARAPRTVTVRDGRIVDDTGPGDLRRPAGARVAAVRSGGGGPLAASVVTAGEARA